MVGGCQAMIATSSPMVPKERSRRSAVRFNHRIHLKLQFNLEFTFCLAPCCFIITSIINPYFGALKVGAKINGQSEQFQTKVL